ncbi:hypothetical protein SAMN02745132_04923 [Enterovibrio nigricans DSM 22720]|uniref:Uncharacterized protein n=1 Tax=Enterovibrio nigricans DSM 22720 TaxID=1121868 RepID=A0A1T4WI82_9GAMM|nr:hypothetical protein SAMN02745132_04923 [Enterovibrio nigricans DSM 22720]
MLFFEGYLFNNPDKTITLPYEHLLYIRDIMLAHSIHYEYGCANKFHAMYIFICILHI